MSKQYNDCQTIRYFKINGTGKSITDNLKRGKASIYNYVIFIIIYIG